MSIKRTRGLPWWLSGKKSACRCRRYRFNPCSGKISHSSEQLSLCPTTIEPVLRAQELQLLNPTCPEPMRYERGHCSEKPCIAASEWPLLAENREKPAQQGKEEEIPWWSNGWDSTLLLQGAWVQSLVRKLRSCMPCSAGKNNKKRIFPF